MNKRASAIIPAYNEEKHIFDIVQLACAHPLIKEVIVVTDGCSDATADRAREAGATMVIELAKNVGKGQAMDVGVRRASEDTLVFLDADLTGLTADMLGQLIEPVLKDETDMMTLRLDLPVDVYYSVSPLLDLSGERCVRRSLWEAVPVEHRTGYSVEVALNHYAQQQGLRVKTAYCSGLSSLGKEQKHGYVTGVLYRWAEMAEWGMTLARLRMGW